MASDDKPLRVSRGFVDGIPHNKALGIKVVEFRRAEAIFELPYDTKLVGNPDTGVLHGGAITALLDACSGAAVFAALTEWQPIATLDLRIDYLRTGDVDRAIRAKATCYRITRNVAFTRAIAYHDDDEADPIASSVGTFMLGTKPAGGVGGTGLGTTGPASGSKKDAP
ncbi:MAG TPA: PaaI family thioesterase [Kofleriaceae bacterium]|nr:PaaI family thioesterase [Kofleriaceae bacterium]